MPLSRDTFTAEARKRAQEIAFEHDWTETSSSRRELAGLIQEAIVDLVEASRPRWAAEAEEESA